MPPSTPTTLSPVSAPTAVLAQDRAQRLDRDRLHRAALARHRGGAQHRVVHGLLGRLERGLEERGCGLGRQERARPGLRLAMRYAAFGRRAERDREIAG